MFLSILLSLILIIITYFKWSYQYWKRKNIPYVPPVAPFGNFQSMFTRTTSLGQQSEELYKKFKKMNAKIGGVYITSQPILLPMDLDQVKNILAKDFSHFVDRGAYYNERDDPISAHLFNIGGTKWKNLRSKFTPTFTTGKMKMMFHILSECGQMLEDYVAKQDLTNPLEVTEVAGCFTTDVIGSCAFGLDINSFTDPDKSFVNIMKTIFILSNFRALKTMFAHNFPNLARFLRIPEYEKSTSNFFFDLVTKTVNYREKNNISRDDFMQILINIKNNSDSESEVGNNGTALTMEDVVAQCFVFFLAGFETSSATTSFAFYELALHQDIQDAVRDEINEVLERHDDKITYESLSEMKYMMQVIDETLRKYPPLPFVTRTCIKDYEVPETDLIVEKGTRCLIPILGIHHDDEYYPQPEKFDPDRFSEKNKQKRHPYAYLAFGAGPRICLGMRFGIMETKMCLAVLLRKYKFTVDEKTDVPLRISISSFTTRAENGIWLKLEEIK